MAKQSGLHQIRGKVGEHSYYRQSGVDNGLIRRINQGMSNRVKTGAEFANTRLNNKEFKVAANMAKAFGSMIVPKFRPMLLTFSQSKLTKGFLEILKSNAGGWGLRYLIAANNAQMLDAVNALAKIDFSEFVQTFAAAASETPGEVDIQILMTSEAVNALISKGATGIDVRVQYRSVYGAKYDGDTFELYIGRVTAPSEDGEDFVAGQPVSLTPIISETSHTAWTESDRIFDEVELTVMPYRKVDGVKHTLQELCTYKVIEAPARA